MRDVCKTEKNPFTNHSYPPSECKTNQLKARQSIIYSWATLAQEIFCKNTRFESPVGKLLQFKDILLSLRIVDYFIFILLFYLAPHYNFMLKVLHVFNCIFKLEIPNNKKIHTSPFCIHSLVSSCHLWVVFPGGRYRLRWKGKYSFHFLT